MNPTGGRVVWVVVLQNELVKLDVINQPLCQLNIRYTRNLKIYSLPLCVLATFA